MGHLRPWLTQLSLQKNESKKRWGLGRKFPLFSQKKKKKETRIWSDQLSCPIKTYVQTRFIHSYFSTTLRKLTYSNRKCFVAKQSNKSGFWRTFCWPKLSRSRRRIENFSTVCSVEKVILTLTLKLVKKSQRYVIHVVNLSWQSTDRMWVKIMTVFFDFYKTPVWYLAGRRLFRPNFDHSPSSIIGVFTTLLCFGNVL